METQRARRPQLLLTMTAIGLAGGLMGTHAISHTGQFSDKEVFIVGVCAAFLSAAMAFFVVVGASTSTKAVWAALGATVIAAMANSPLSFLVVSVANGRPFGGIELFGGMVAAAIIGAFITVPLGLVFSVPYMFVIGLTHRLSRDRSHEAFERTLLICGLWLVVVALCCLPLGLSLVTTATRTSDFITGLTLASSMTAVLGVIVSIAASIRLLIRRRWVARLKTGSIPNLALLEIDDLMLGTEHLRPVLTTIQPPEFVIVRRHRNAGRGAYRTAEHLEPVALL